MVKLNKLYTRNGDKGCTHLCGGEVVEKTSCRVTAMGDVDELNSHLGLARTLLETTVAAQKHSSPEVIDIEILVKHVSVIQNELFDIGSRLATLSIPEGMNLPQISRQHVERLEEWIDELALITGELRSFVLPGGTRTNAVLHLARSVCRRAERSILLLHKEVPVDEATLIYMNRLSDYLFAAARRCAQIEQAKEFLWIPGGSLS
jgi:cob(I)alamin adenosyltransferase